MPENGLSMSRWHRGTWAERWRSVWGGMASDTQTMRPANCVELREKGHTWQKGEHVWHPKAGWAGFEGTRQSTGNLSGWVVVDTEPRSLSIWDLVGKGIAFQRWVSQWVSSGNVSDRRGGSAELLRLQWETIRKPREERGGWVWGQCMSPSEGSQEFYLENRVEENKWKH